MNTNIVVSRYNKNVDFVYKINNGNNINVLIYDKENPNNPLNIPVNKGNEASVYLKYIIDYYDELSEFTFFIHDDEYAWHHTGSIIDKYNEAVMSNKMYYNINDKSPWNVPNKSCDYYNELLNWYNIYIEEYIPISKVPNNKDFLYGYQGSAQFLVHKDLIRNLPKEFYIKLYEWIITTDLPNSLSGRFLEWTWHIFWYIYPNYIYNRINYIKDSNLQDLQNNIYLEKLIIKLGFNGEILREQPKIVKDNVGGLLIWQYPNQFSKYLCLLREQKINSYIEIGCRWGGTFILTNEYLKKFNTINKSVAIDIIDSPVLNYCISNNETTFIKINSQSEEFINYIKNNYFDLIFIDANHGYNYIKNDYQNSKNSGKIFVFHDIINDMCPGVVQFWNELKNNENDTYDFFEFTEQYEDVWNDTQQHFLGIGVAIKKNI
jgi:cephalosporin hydroxylase